MSALAFAASIYAVRLSRRVESIAVPPSLQTGNGWTAADETAVAELMTKTGQQLGGYLATLKRGTSRHKFTVAQIEEALSRQRRSQDWKALTNAASIMVR